MSGPVIDARVTRADDGTAAILLTWREELVVLPLDYGYYPDDDSGEHALKALKAFIQAERALA